MERNRIMWVDTARCICIYFVIITHLESCTSSLYRFYGPFFLTGFLFLSGYCYKHRDGFLAMLRKKTLQLFIPWLLWGLLSVAFHQLFSGFRKNKDQIMSLGKELKWFFLQVRGINDGPWFFAMLFVSFLLFFFLIRFYEKNKSRRAAAPALLAALGLLYLAGKLYTSLVPPFSYGTNALPWHLEYLPTSLFFMFLGYLYRSSGKSDAAAPPLSRAWIPLVYLALVFAPLLFGQRLRLRAPAAQLYEAVSEYCGVLFVLWLGRLLRPNALTRFMGRNTLLVFPMHVYIYTLFEYALRRFLPETYAAILSGAVSSVVFALVFAFVIACVLILPIMIVNRYFPILAGKAGQKAEKQPVS